jgi:UDP-2,4-diacetamido-2,4,6-trideoxy-beta-L-altropyranose hydrolase
MRCSTLARALQERGHHVCFAMRETTSLVDELLRDYRFTLAAVPATDEDFRAPTVRGRGEASSVSPQSLTVAAPLCPDFDAVLVDHYAASSAYLDSVARQGVLVAAIDDLADRELMAVDWLLNQNLGAETLPYRLRSDCVRLLGPRYSLLRPQFREARLARERAFSPADRKVLITLGGGDSSRLYAEILTSLNHVALPLTMRLLVPGQADDLMAGLAKLSRHSVEILHNAANMADHMAWADVSINAGGSTCWELCCVGVPMLIVVLSRDQDIVAAGLEQAGAGRRLSGSRDPVNDVGVRVEHLLTRPQERATMSARAQAIVDGLGAERAAASLEAAVKRRLGKEHDHSCHRSA